MKKIIGLLAVLVTSTALAQWNRGPDPVDGSNACLRDTGEVFNSERYDGSRSTTIGCRTINDFEVWLASLPFDALKAWFNSVIPESKAAISASVALNYDSTVNTAYPNGDKPQGGSSPVGWTVAAIGDAVECTINDSGGTWTITVSTPNTDVEGRCIAYQTEASDTDKHVEFRLVSSSVPAAADFAGVGAFMAEGATINDYAAYTWFKAETDQPIIKTGVPSAPFGQACSTGQTEPEYITLDYDDTDTELRGGHGTDGANWTQCGADVTKSLTFPIIYGIEAHGYRSSSISTFVIDSIVENETNEIAGGGSPPATLLFEEDFTSTTWYNNNGWGAGKASQGGPSLSPRFGCGGAGEVNVRVTDDSANGVTAIDGPFLRTRIVSGNHCGTNAGIYLSEIMPSLPGPGDEVYLRAYIAFGDNFDATQNGKFGGWSDSGDGDCGSGGAPCDGTDGWSARSKHSTGGGCTPATSVPMDGYIYHADMPGTFGEHFDWANAGCGEARVAVQGTWYCLELQVKMNTGSNNDGEYKVWVDGNQLANRTNMKWDTTGNFPIYRFWMNVYHGGGQTAPQNMDMYWDHIAVSETQIGCDL